jgi:hypothetical protein
LEAESVRTAEFRLPSRLVRLPLLLVVALSVTGQEMISPSTPGGRAWIERFEQDLAAAAAAPRLKCTVRPIKPVISFAFRYQAGYEAVLPVDQFPQSATTLRIRFRVISRQTNARHYFRRAGTLPPGLRRRRDVAGLSGGFLIGEGDYRIDWLLTDAEGRSCQKSWEIRLRLKSDEREVASLMAPGEVAPLALASWRRLPPARQAARRVALFLHVAPIHPRSVQMGQLDQALLVTTLISLFEQTPLRASSFHAISLHRQQELVRAPGFDEKALRALRETMDELELATIGIEQLRAADGAARLLARLAAEQMTSAEPPEALIFVGPVTRESAGDPRRLLGNLPGPAPPVFYLRLNYFPRWFPFDDPIEKLTRSLGGRVFQVSNPRQFARALREIEAALAKRQDSAKLR